MTVYIAIDDTDMPDTPGTGKLAREIALQLGRKFTVQGITRHQLLVHPDIPYTSHNSAAVIHLEDVPDENLDTIFEEVTSLVKNRAAPGSDPGVCLATEKQISPAIIVFGKDAKSMVLTQEMACTLAAHTGIRLAGLDGTKGGIIGSLAAVGLAAHGSDGRYIQVGTIRDLHGEADIRQIKEAGIPAILSLDGKELHDGRVLFRKFPQPIRIQKNPVLLVREDQGTWVTERRD